MRRFDSSTSWTQAQERPEISTQPARPAGFVSDVLVPAAQAAITGLLLGTILTAAALALAGDTDGALLLWLALVLVIAAFTWILLLVDTRRLLWAVERFTGQDLDGDGKAGKPGHLVFVNRQRAKAQAAKDRDDAEWRAFLGFVSRLGVKGTTVAAWESELGRPLYNQFRDALIDYGFARWKSYKKSGRPNTNGGWYLLHEPEEIIAQLKIERA